jgi:transaldolase
MAVNGQTRLSMLRKFGQSVWLDFISRDLISSGGLRRHIDRDGVTGLTSNPTIFEKAISAGSDYDDQIAALRRQGLSAPKIFARVAATDVRDACDAFLPRFERTAGADGYASIEVDPNAADDTERTLKEVRRLRDLVGRPNLMVKIPATPAGIPAIRRALEDGININVTLMFSTAHYDAVVEAFLSALEARRRSGEPIDHIASVASFFVSRVDTLVDAKLDELLASRPSKEARRRLDSLRGRLAVANSKLVYDRFAAVHTSSRWRLLAGEGARVQRLLWASTSTKNPAYSDVLYVDGLIGPDTVTTLTSETMAAFNDHGRLARSVDEDVDEARRRFDEAAAAGLDMDAVTEQLQADGVAAFAKSYAGVVQAVERRYRRVGEAA